MLIYLLNMGCTQAIETLNDNNVFRAYPSTNIFVLCLLTSLLIQVRSNDRRMVVIGGVDPHDRVSNQLFAINSDMSKSEFLPPMHEGLCR